MALDEATAQSSLLLVFRMLIEQAAEIEALRSLLRRLDREDALDWQSVEQERNLASAQFAPLLRRIHRLEGGRVPPLQISDILEILEGIPPAKLQ